MFIFQFKCLPFESPAAPRIYMLNLVRNKDNTVFKKKSEVILGSTNRHHRHYHVL